MIVGVGVTAFSRISLKELGWEFMIMSGRSGFGVEDLELKIKVVGGETTEEILERSLKFLEKMQVDYIATYRSSEKIEKLVRKLGAGLLVVPWQLRQKLENKCEFTKIKEELNLKLPQAKELEGKREIKKWVSIWKRKKNWKVLQDCDGVNGGGRGTLLVRGRDDYNKLKKWIIERKRILVMDYIKGEELAINGCVTKKGVVVGEIRKQLVDKEGRFYGSSWGNISVDRKRIERIVKLVGKKLNEIGYRGVFGLDLFLSKGELIVGECNSRLTGNFPVSSLIAKWHGLTSLELVHYYEWLNEQSKFDVEKINKSYGRVDIKAGQLILKDYEIGDLECKKELSPGIYQYKEGSFRWVRNGFGEERLGKDEFVLTDGVLGKGEKIKQGQRFGRLIFGRSIMEGEELGEFAIEARNWIMKMMFD